MKLHGVCRVISKRGFEFVLLVRMGVRPLETLPFRTVMLIGHVGVLVCKTVFTAVFMIIFTLFVRTQFSINQFYSWQRHYRHEAPFSYCVRR